MDYGNSNFSVSQVDWSGKSPHFVAISTNTTSTSPPSSTSSTAPSSSAISVTSQSSGLSSSAIVGIAIGIAAIAILLASAIIFVIWRKRKRDRESARLPELEGNGTGDQQTQMKASRADYFSRYPDKQAPNDGIIKKENELDGGAVKSPSSQHNATNPNLIPIPELSGSEIHRAELHSPEPDRSRSPTLVNRSSVLTSEPEHTRQPWTARLEMPSPGLSSRDSIAAADLTHGVQHSPQMPPSPETELPSPRAGSSTSAFQSPVIGYTRFTNSPPITPRSGPLSHDHESDCLHSHPF